MINKKLLLASVVTIAISGCSFEYVPPATKGKVLTTSGYNPETLPPGKYTLWGRDKLILLKTNTNTYKEQVKVILQDKLSLMVDVRFRGRISGTDSVVNSMFNDIAAGSDSVVEFNEVYSIYGKMVVRNKVREIISQYTVEDVHKNYSRLSKEIGKAIVIGLKGTPLEVSDVSLGDIEYPKVVTDAVEAAKERDLAIKKEEAQSKINLTKKKNERLLAEADYQIQITKAKAVRDSNKIMGENLTPALLTLKNIEMLKSLSGNANAVYLPYEALDTTGASVKMFK